MTSGISEMLKNKQLPIDSSRLSKPNNQIPIGAVDKLADELVAEYSNPKYRVWYCKVIYEFGVERVHEWRTRALEGREPAKLFSKYVKDASTFRSSRSRSDG